MPGLDNYNPLLKHIFTNQLVYLEDVYVTQRVAVKAFIRGLGVRMMEECDSLETGLQDMIVDAVGAFILNLFVDIKQLKPVRDSSNNPYLESYPEVMPLGLCSTASTLNEQVVKQKQRLLSHGWTEEMFEKIPSGHQHLKLLYNNDADIRMQLDACSAEYTSVNEAWDIVGIRAVQHPLYHLRQFCGGLASLWPNTARVESDFYVIGLEKTDQCLALSDFSLEGILQAKQLKELCLVK